MNYGQKSKCNIKKGIWKKGIKKNVNVLIKLEILTLIDKDSF